MKKQNIKPTIILIIAIILISVFAIMFFNRAETVRVLIIGDSISAGAGASDVDKKWYKFLVPYFRETYNIKLDIKNISEGGSTSYLGYCRFMQEEKPEEYDIVIICYGENDFERDIDVQYENLLRNVMARCTNAKIYSILESSQQDYTPKIKTIQKLCDYYGITTIDTIQAFKESGYEYSELTDDGIHPNDLGHKVYFEMSKDVLEKDILKDRPDYDITQNAISDVCTHYGAFIFISKEEMAINGMELSVSGSDIIKMLGAKNNDNCHAIIGIDFDPIKGNNLIDVYADDMLIQHKEFTWEYDFTLESIEISSYDLEVNEVLDTNTYDAIISSVIREYNTNIKKDLQLQKAIEVLGN